MEPGFVIDKSYGGDYGSTPEWTGGTPEPSFWTGIKFKGKERLQVTTYRCSTCGRLESYAH
jgi:hypothetical protein